MSACPELEAPDWERFLAEDRAAAELSDALLARCVRRLAEDWRHLNEEYLGGRLRPPSIRLHEGERRWGSWDPARRLITIAKRQVLAYTWASVLETLKHEMAHQYVSEVLDGDDEPPHGRLFREVCRKLVADPAPRGDGGVSLLRPGGTGARASRDDARLRRVHKLLALADNNPDEHEARTAFARAAELMLKYNIEADCLRGERDYVHRALGKVSARVPHHHYLIASILQDFFFVQCVWVDSYDARRGKAGSLLEVLGTRANVEMAAYVHACLTRQCESLWQAYRTEHRIKDRRARRQYLDGLLSGFRRQLRSEQQRHQERGLVLVGDPGLARYFRRRHPRVRTTRLSASARSEAREAGLAAGERLRLRKPLGSGQARSRGRCLPGA
ncbi:MAG: DUF2786 domain-containing protein [Planctomycetota bacterium]|nr:MAG: DUF2786 domain-containing protein [Planctomycetota bacterium]